jgi:hypothetical protein
LHEVGRTNCEQTGLFSKRQRRVVILAQPNGLGLRAQEISGLKARSIEYLYISIEIHAIVLYPEIEPPANRTPKNLVDSFSLQE